MNRLLLAVTLAAPLSLLACKDPGKEASKAVTEEAKTTQAQKAGEVIPFDSKTSKLGFVGSKVTGSHTGNFGNFEGRVELVDGKIEASSVRVDIDMKSVTSDTEKLTGHLKSKDFFEVDRFPKATFVSTKIVPGGEKGASHTITGNLELHGVTKSISFPATIAVTNEAVTANANFAIDRTNWGINYEGMADNLIRKDVVLELSIKAPRNKG